MREPPIPKSLTPGQRSVKARQRVPPWRSPDASPAESMMETRSERLIDAYHADPGAHGRDVEAVVLRRAHRLHHDAARPGQPAAAANRLVGALCGLYGDRDP